MAIREEIVLDYRGYIDGLKKVDSETLKSAKKQEANYKNASRQMKQLEGDIASLKRARDLSNDPKKAREYTQTIKSLQVQYDKLEKETKEYGRALKKTGEESERASKGIANSAKRIGQNIKFWVSAVAVAALVQLQRAVISASGEFEKQFSQVRTLLNETEVDTSSLRDRLIELSKIKPVSLSLLTPALYQVISSGITDVNKALDVLSVAADSAIAGDTSVETAVNGITTALNAWSLEADEAESVSDSFFVAVRNGKTTFEELSSSIGRVAPLASATNTSLDELLSSVAALTSGGLNTSEAMTSMRGILAKILKPTQQAKEEAKKLGLEFSQSALEAKGLYLFLNEVGDAANGNTESLGKLFEDVEALNGVLSLTGDSSRFFSKNLEDMKDSSGETEVALSKVEGILFKVWETTKGKVNAQLMELGKTILPLVTGGLKALNKTLDTFDDPSQVLINNLREIGADKELIIKMQAELDVRKASKQFFELEDELKGKSIPIEFDIKTRTVSQGEAAQAKGSLAAGQIQTSIINTKEIDVASASIEELESGLSTIKNRLEDIGEGSTNFNKLTTAQREEINMLSSSLSILEQTIAIRKQQEVLQITIANGYSVLNEVKKKSNELSEQGVENVALENEAKNLDRINSIIDEYIKKKESAKKLHSDGGLSGTELIDLDTQSAKDGLNTLRELYTQLEMSGELTEKLSESFNVAFNSLNIDNATFEKGKEIASDFYDGISDAVSTDGQSLVSLLDVYNSKLVELSNQLTVGRISTKEYLEYGKNASKEFLDELKAIYSTLILQGKITPELEKSFLSFFGKANKGIKEFNTEAEETNDKLEEVKVSFGDIADSLSGLLGVADAFGKIDDNLKNVLRGSIDVFRNIENIQKLSANGKLGIEALVPALGVASGIGSIISGLLNDNDDSSDQAIEEMANLQFQLKENRKAILNNTEALLSGGLALAGTSNENIEDAQRKINYLIDFGLIDLSRLGDIQGSSKIKSILKDLEDTGLFDGLISSFENLIDQGYNPEEVLNAILSGETFGFEGLQNILDRLTSSFGAFTQDLDGAIEEFNQSIRFGGVDTKEALTAFIKKLSGLGSESLDAKLQELNNIDLETEEGQKALDLLIKDLFENRSDYYGELTPEEFTDLLDFLKNLNGDLANVEINSLQDAIDAFAARIRYGGLSLAEAVDSFVEDFSGNFSGSKELIELLQELEDQDLETAGGQDFLDALIKNLFDNQANLQGELTDDDFNSLLEFLKGLDDPTTSSDVSRNVVGTASITEFQASQDLVLQEAQLYTLKQMLFELETISGLTTQEGGVSVNNVNNFNVNGINISAGLSEQDIESITNQFANFLKNQSRGGAFG